LISFSAVAKRYPGGQDALAGVSFTLAAGEFAFVIGPSGAGKSTLLKLIPAIERPTSGSVVVNGQNVGALKRAAVPYLRRNLGLVFQDHKLLYDRSVFDNVMLPLSFGALAPRDAARRVRAALDKVGLLARERANPIQLSGGEQQRLAIARAVVNRPAVLGAGSAPRGPGRHRAALAAADLRRAPDADEAPATGAAPALYGDGSPGR
jgi:cell division transport system ATP-binding protein